MSSSQPYLQSSPIALNIGSGRRKSRFTFRQLSQLGASSTTCPLRVIGHIDLDAFYAQCEMVRLGLPEDQPLAVQQWQGLIAINYPARKFGMNRHINITEAKKLCPNIIMQHVATWKEGDEKWAYHEDAFAHMGTHKVSLDPYRLQCRKILECIKGALPPTPIQKVEKASIDEVFLDLSAQVHAILLERYPELQGPPPYDDPTENLPPPPTSALDWNTDALVDLDAQETEDDDPDWDDIGLLIGSEIVRSVRAAIREKMKYTCSAGVARNKMLAKLGSAHKKPNQQTVIRNRAVKQFLGDYKFTKIRNLGGKLGDEIVEAFGTDTVKDLLEVSFDRLKNKVGDDTGTWVYNVIRGDDNTEVNPRTQIKSMLSAKSFRPTINSFEQACRWLRIFSADIFSRLVEEGVLEHKRRPKIMNLHHRQGADTRSKSIQIPQGKTPSEEILFELSKTLLSQVIIDGRAWPCANLSLAVSGFENGPVNNQGIGNFLVKGEEAKTMNATRHAVPTESGGEAKRRKLDSGDIHKFLARTDSSRGESIENEDDLARTRNPSSDARVPDESHDSDQHLFLSDDEKAPTQVQASMDTYICKRCSAAVPNDGKSEHEDWHFAKELYASERSAPATNAPVVAKKHSAVKPSRGPKKPGGSVGSKEKGQSKLNFGR